jgi:hypothetical protein
MTPSPVVRNSTSTLSPCHKPVLPELVNSKSERMQEIKTLVLLKDYLNVHGLICSVKDTGRHSRQKPQPFVWMRNALTDKGKHSLKYKNGKRYFK